MTILLTLYVATSGLALTVAAIVLWRRAVWRRKVFSHVRRDRDGHLYAEDPQTGAWHRLILDPIAETVTVARKDDEASPRQKRRQRRERRALGLAR